MRGIIRKTRIEKHEVTGGKGQSLWQGRWLRYSGPPPCSDTRGGGSDAWAEARKGHRKAQKGPGGRVAKNSGFPKFPRGGAPSLATYGCRCSG